MKDPSAVVHEIQMTEKGTTLSSEQNRYIFRVARTANKIEIKRAVEQLFSVSVAAVNTMTYRGKKKRERTMSYGKRADWKRAVVTLAEGSSIDLT